MDSTKPARNTRAIEPPAMAGGLLAIMLLCGCQSITPDHPDVDTPQGQAFTLRTICPQRAQGILSPLGYDCTVTASDPNTLWVHGPVRDLEKAAAILDVVDSNEPYIAGLLSPASMVRALPSNGQIAQAIGDVAIGTFAQPPGPGPTARAIIDVQGDSVVAIAPARLLPDIRAVVELGPDARRSHPTPGPPSPIVAGPVEIDASTEILPVRRQPPATDRDAPEPVENQVIVERGKFAGPPADAVTSDAPGPAAAGGRPRLSAEQPPADEPNARESAPRTSPTLSDASVARRGILRASPKIEKTAPAASTPRAEISFPNGDDVLELTLPEKIELMQLLDLAGQYLGLDCIYEAEKIGNQMITLKLHSKMQSEMRVKDLYTLLQTVLKFKGLVMTRLEGNLVSVVPAAEAMEIDPQLVDPNNGALRAGDVVVTRIFDLQHVDAASVTNLIQNMKLSLAVSPIPETQTLFVTCYAHRMARIEQLVDMVDRPGRPREFRFRQLGSTMATTLALKIRALAAELEGISISVGATDPNPQAQRNPPPAGQAARSAAGAAVYLDTDDRTNRILMIGPVEQLETVEGLIDALDIPQQDLRTIHVYPMQQTTAQAALDKLTQLGIAAKAGQTARSPKAPAGSPNTAESSPDEEPQVILLEATNSLLVNAAAQQHAQIRMVLDHVDVAPQDLRTLRIYPIRHVDAQDVAVKFRQLELLGQATKPSAGPAPVSAGATTGEGALDTCQVIVLEVTNSLLVNATPTQHDRIEAVIRYIDVEAPRATVPYEIYFLENQDPEQLSGVLGKLIQETITGADGKVEKTLAKTDEQVTIIPDKNTFSLIVHASRKNQDWIAGLIEKLDKRRPQVLIDVTLVEITETEAFNYDLNLIASAPDLTHTSGLTGAVVPGVTSGDILDRLNTSGRSQFADMQSESGELTAFYGDKHINMLLQAMQSKNYGRILAKPKILVNDNEPGMIKTADTTYVAKRSSIPVGSGAAGNDVTLIETAVAYEPYEAGITLDITPHISQGDLLRMEIQLTRSDFRETEDAEKPPDQTASELKTTAFVPDGSTIILGGLLRLNQNKGGAKVPILGDIPLVGGLFRTINNRDTQSKLYIFVKAEIIRPAGTLSQEMVQLEALSKRNREAFEEHEQEFQGYQSWPGIKPRPIDPPKVLEAR